MKPDTIRSLARPDWLNESAWPWPISSVDTSAGHLAFTDVGRGPVLLLAHVGAWSFLWRDLLRDLAADFRCVVFDSPGSGLSERLPEASVSVEAASAAIGDLVDSLELERFTLVVHDLGGPAAIAAASARPDRIEALVAVNTFAWRPAGAGFIGMLRLMGSRAMTTSDALLAWLPRGSSGRFGAGRNWSADDRAIFRRGLDVAAVRAWHRYFGTVLAAGAMCDRADALLKGELRDRPLLTVFGERNDPMHFQPRWRELFPAARQVVVPKGYHFPMCDNPALVSAAIRKWHTTDVISTRREPMPDRSR